MAKPKSIKVIDTDIAKLKRINAALRELVKWYEDDHGRDSHDSSDLPEDLVELEQALTEAENS